MLRLVGRMMGLVWWVAALVRVPDSAEPGPAPAWPAWSAGQSQPQLPGAAQSAVSSQHRDTEQRWHTRGHTGILQSPPACRSELLQTVWIQMCCAGVWREPAHPGPLMWSNKLVRTSQPLCARTHVRWAALSATEQGPDWSRLELTEVNCTPKIKSKSTVNCKRKYLNH